MKKITFLVASLLFTVLLNAQFSPGYIFGNNENGAGWNWALGIQGTASLGQSYKWQFTATATGDQYMKFGNTNSTVDGQGFWVNNAPADMDYTALAAPWTAYFNTAMWGGGAIKWPAISGNHYIIKSKVKLDGNADFVVFNNGTQAPSTIFSVTRTISGTNLNVDVTLNSAKAVTEKVWVRFTTDNWDTSTSVEAATNTTGNTWNAVLALADGDFVSYYAYTTIGWGSFDEELADFLTIEYSNNGGHNYTAQIGPLTGDYYIPQGYQDKGFSSLTNAFKNIDDVGLSGTVNLLVDNLAEGNAMLNRNDLTGTNNLVIKPASVEMPSTISFMSCTASGPNAYSGLTLNGVSNVTIDGRNSLTINMNDNKNGRDAITLFGNCDNVTIKNLEIIYTSIGSTSTGRGIYLNGQSTGAADNCRIDNCTIGENTPTLVGPHHGIGFTGSSGSTIYCNNGEISNNTIYANIRGINLYYHNGAASTFNCYRNNVSIMNPAVGNVTWGILHQNYAGTSNFDENIISNITQKSNSTQGIYGFGTLNGTAESVTNITNNFLGGNYNHTGTGIPASIDIISFQDAPASAVVRVYHNTIVLNDLSKTASTRMTGIRFNPASGSTFAIKNNIIINNKNAAVAYGLYFGGSVTTFMSDYNDIYVSGVDANIGYIGAAKKTLANWQAGSFQDVNSKSVNVQFVDLSGGDLSLTGGSEHNDYLAVPTLGEVPVDIWGTPRPTPYTYAGAHQAAMPFYWTSVKTPDVSARILRTYTGVHVELDREATVEIYTINGVKIDKVITSGIYSRDLNNGVYIIRINGKATKFIK